MLVELVVDVAEGGLDLEKAKVAAAMLGIGPEAQGYPRLKKTKSRGKVLEYKKGAKVEISVPSADKWIKRGIAKAVK